MPWLFTGRWCGSVIIRVVLAALLTDVWFWMEGGEMVVRATNRSHMLGCALSRPRSRLDTMLVVDPS